MCENLSMMSDESGISRLRIDMDRDGDTVVVRCGGKLVAGVTEYLYADVRRLIPESKRIVLDLTELTYMDSRGLGTIIRLFVSARAAGCDLELVNVGERIRKLLGLTNLLSIFTVCGEHHVRLP